jgi:hypothetical protein
MWDSHWWPTYTPHKWSRSQQSSVPKIHWRELRTKHPLKSRPQSCSLLGSPLLTRFPSIGTFLEPEGYKTNCLHCGSAQGGGARGVSRGAVFQAGTNQVYKTCDDVSRWTGMPHTVELAQMIHIHAARVVTISAIKNHETTGERNAHRKSAKIKITELHPSRLTSLTRYPSAGTLLELLE